MKKFLGVLLSATILITSTVFTPAANATVYGDADNNGVINIVDVALLLNKVLINSTMPIESDADYLKYMDLNADGSLNSADVAELLQMVINSTYKPNAVPEETTEVTTVATTETTTETTTEATTVATTEATTEVTTEATTEVTTEATTEATTEVTSEATTEVTTIDTSDGVVVENFNSLKNEISKRTAKIYVKGTIDCKEQLALNDKNANVSIIGLTNPDGTGARLDFTSYFKASTSGGERATGVYIKGTHYNFENLIIEKAPDCGVRIKGSGTGHCTFTNCVFRYNQNSGISVTAGGEYNTFTNCDSYRNGDVIRKCGDDADGFSVKLGAGNGNKFYNCRAWENSDDGWDSYDQSGQKTQDVYYEECLAWHNGNPETFTGEYDYAQGYALDKNLVYVQAILESDPDFEAKYNAKTVTSWPKVTMRGLGTSRDYNTLIRNWGGNPNGFKFASAYTPKGTYRYIKNCIAFDHFGNKYKEVQFIAKGFDQNGGPCDYDLENTFAFNNVRNYEMEKMNPKSIKGAVWANNGVEADSPSTGMTITTPSNVSELEAKVYAYRDMIYDYVYNDKIPGEQICNIF